MGDVAIRRSARDIGDPRAIEPAAQPTAGMMPATAGATRSDAGSAGAAIALRDVRFGYDRANAVLDIARLDVARGERVFLYGPSGSGKTTMLGILAGVLQADAGEVRVLGENLTRRSGRLRDRFRARHIGYIFQMFNLIPYLSVLENIVLPCLISTERRRRLNGVRPADAAAQLSHDLGIAHLIGESVTRLSVGQQQRVAAARALIGAPELVIADEPTSSLDADRRVTFLDLLFRVCKESGSTLVFVSHDLGLEQLFDRSLSLAELNKVDTDE